MNGSGDDPNLWWSELNHSGMFLSPAVIREFLPEGPSPVDSDAYKKLRDAYTAFEAWSGSRQERDNTGLYRWLDAVFEQFLGYPAGLWQKETGIHRNFKFQTSIGEQLRPNRVLLQKGKTLTPWFFIKVDTGKGRLGMGKGRVEFSKFLTLLGGTGTQLGIFTNGHQFRLVFVGMDYDCWVEWDAARWFEEESGIGQLEGFAALCGKNGTYETDEEEFPLLNAVLKSRTRQGELSQVLGEQVRFAVETLLSDFDKAVRTHPSLLEPLCTDPVTKKELTDTERFNALYHAAIRVIMRLVVVLFAEARELLPRNIEKYHASYGVEGLFALLEEAKGHEGEIGLRESYSAWPRLLALFRVIHEGGCNNDIPVLRYGGELFKRGDPSSPDPVLRALSIFEDDRWTLNDYTVHEILRFLKIGKVRARRGRTSTWVSGPVDFSDLRTEYIGMMYEGLLDYQLRQVTEDEGAVLFLNLGQQPALPLSLLESLSDKELRNLVRKLQKEKTTAPISEEGEEELYEEELEEELLEESTEETVSEGFFQTEEQKVKNRVYQWAERAVEIGKLIKKPQEADLYAYNEEKRKKANELLWRVYYPRQMYLVRWSGTRKGTGTFYTRPQLAVPTVHRTLEPLVYDKKEETGELIPKEPGTILSLKIVDPAMGSASFLVAALRYVTDALYESLLYHKKIKERSSGESVITLPFGLESKGGIPEELLPVPPDDERFEQMLKARLKRHVVERCIYGVDIDPLAVELGQLSLWVETMDRELPFEFLKHKLKVGNSLVGCWLDRFEDYPVLAWAREGGDGSKGPFTRKIKKIFGEQVKPQMKKWIERMGPQRKLTAWMEEESVVEIQERNLDLYSRLHELNRDEKELFFRENIQNNESLNLLKRALDKWCAIWFWPVDDEDIQPLTPDRFYQPHGDDDEIAEIITRKAHFFHWEIEFPDVFADESSGFDAILGNPPWDTLEPLSAEFFTRFDPIYRTYGKQEALKHQEQLFESDSEIEGKWLQYTSNFKNLGNWVKNVAYPFGDPSENDGIRVVLQRGKANTSIHNAWRELRKKRFGYSGPSHPFRNLGHGKHYTYKMFLDLAYFLLKDNGRLGMIVPSSLYTSLGSVDLRNLFLDKCRWEWLYGFENSKKIFDTHSSSKFEPIVIQKSGETEAIKTAFMRNDLSEWEYPDKFIISYRKDFIKLFSPISKILLEVKTESDLKILEKIYRNSVFLGHKVEGEWKIEYTQGDFNISSDSELFPPITEWLDEGYKSDQYGRWIGPNGDIALPLYEGRMVGQFDFSEKGWTSGKGRGAVWRIIPFQSKKVEPQFLIKKKRYKEWKKGIKGYKIIFMDVTSATNERTMIATILNDMPSGHSAPLLKVSGGEIKPTLMLTAILNSFAYDYVARASCGGLHLNYFIMKETPLPMFSDISDVVRDALCLYSARLTFIHDLFAFDWLNLRNIYINLESVLWKSLWAITNHERLRLRCILDAIVAELYGLDFDDFVWILRYDPSDLKGFWRVDKDKSPELRQTTLALLAFKRLKEIGLEAFCEENWQFSKEIQEKLGPRFLPWQLEGTPRGTWAECEQHARTILGEEEYKKFSEKLNKAKVPGEKEHTAVEPTHMEEPTKKKEIQTSLSSWSVEE
jgi:hypothetical protein